MASCAECGRGFAPVKNWARHCSADCRAAFNRRRRDRGAEVYDFWMAGDQEHLEKLRAAYLKADATLRASRPSFQPVEIARMQIPMNYGTEGDKR